MKQIFVSFLAGLAGAAVAMTLVSKSFATATTADMNNALASGQCQVDIGRGYLTAGSRCFRGEVMTGIWDDTIYCAAVNVTCY